MERESLREVGVGRERNTKWSLEREAKRSEGVERERTGKENM